MRARTSCSDRAGPGTAKGADARADWSPARRILPVLFLILVGIAIVFAAEPPPNYGCSESPPLGADQESAVTAFRVLAFSLTGLIAIAIGFMAARWSRERRASRGEDPRPGVPTLICATLPVLFFGLVLLAPNDSENVGSILFAYIVYGAIVGFFLVPALMVAGLVIAFAGERWRGSPRAQERLEAATIAIADGLLVFGLPLAVTLAYLQGNGPLFC